MNLYLMTGGTGIPLQDNGALRAARFVNSDLTRLELALEGTPAAIGEAVQTLETALYTARASAHLPAHPACGLGVTLPDGQTWRSPLRGGKLESLPHPAARQVNRQMLVLEVEREPFWEQEGTPLTLINRHGASTNATLYNHSDGAHDDFVDIPASQVQGSLSAPLEVTLSGALSGRSLVLLTAGTHDPATPFPHVLEGEQGVEGSGVSGTTLSASTASAGGYRRLTWSGAEEVTLKRYPLTAAQTAAARGRLYRLTARLHAPLSETLLVWAEAGFDGISGFEPLYAGESAVIPAGAKTLWLPPLRLPPWDVDTLSAGMTLTLKAQAETAGTHTLDLDCLFLTPTEAEARLLPLMSLSALALTYDPRTRGVKFSGAPLLTHTVEGQGIFLEPRQTQRLYVLLERNGAMTIEDTFTLQARPFFRRRWL